MTGRRRWRNGRTGGVSVAGAGLMLALLSSGALCRNILAQTAATSATKATTTAASTAASPYRTTGLTQRARNYFQIFWGIDDPEVKVVESGSMLRFSYKVIDPTKASTLVDKKIAPKLMDPEAKVVLEIPTVEQVGQLRQTAALEAGKSYWMIFSNKRKEVRAGDRVSVVIGRFRADGLYVQ